MELTQDRVHWWVLVLAVLNRCVLQPGTVLTSNWILCKQAVRMELAQDRVHWWVLVLAVLNRYVLQPGTVLTSNWILCK
jgi:uncharacterized membrane protein YczE